MNIALTGSIATDYLMTFPGQFSEQLVEGQLDKISLSFLVEELAIHRGGVAANIAFGLGCLGVRATLVGAVGADFADYGQWLERHNVDTSSVHTSQLRHSARFLCTTDADNNQIASFYPGAMSEAREIELKPIEQRLGSLDLVVVSPNDPEAMLRHTEECRQRGFPFMADPSQQLARLDGDQIKTLVDGAGYLVTNEYECGLLEHKTGWSGDDILDRVDTWITTRGADGATVHRKGEPDVAVPVPRVDGIADPTGVGDAFRSGYLAGVGWQLSPQRSAQLGCMMATLVIETVGTQEYHFDAGIFLERFSEAYGADAAAEVRPQLPG